MTTNRKALAVAATALLTIGVASASPAAADGSTTFVPSSADPWVHTGILIQGGDHITANGVAITWKFNVPGGSISGPEGQPVNCTTQLDSPCLVPGAPYGALVGRIGGGDPFVVGPEYTVGGTEGELELAVNDNLAFYADNAGGYAVHVRR